jgi:hypothetical protein
MTNEEKAQVLEASIYEYRNRGYLNAEQNDAERDAHALRMKALKAGAEALRAMAWKPIADAPDVIEHGALWGHRYPDGRFHSDALTHRDTAMRLMHTHYRELPAPPEGV